MDGKEGAEKDTRDFRRFNMYECRCDAERHFGQSGFAYCVRTTEILETLQLHGLDSNFDDLSATADRKCNVATTSAKLFDRRYHHRTQGRPGYSRAKSSTSTSLAPFDIKGPLPEEHQAECPYTTYPACSDLLTAPYSATRLSRRGKVLLDVLSIFDNVTSCGK